MHEYALADAVVATVLATAAEQQLDRVLSVEVRIGALQRIREQTFRDALTAVQRPDEPRLEGARFDLVTVPAEFRCRPCGHRYHPDVAAETDAHGAEAIHFVPELAHAWLCCPSCDSPDFDIVAGRGVEVGRIEGERDA